MTYNNLTCERVQNPALCPKLGNIHGAVGISDRAAPGHPPLPPETIALIWIGMGFAAFIALVLIGLHWAGKRAERAAQSKIDTSPQEPDQEWAHYPQDEAKLRGK